MDVRLEKYWKVSVAVNWLVLLLVYIAVFIVYWEGPGRYADMGN